MLFRSLDHFVTERRRLAERYRTLLTAISEIRPPLEPSWARSNWQSYCIRLPAGLDQRTVMQSMLDRGISTRRGIMNAHREPPYRNRRHSPLPQSERAQDQCILLPLYVGMSEDDQERVVEALHIAIN